MKNLSGSGRGWYHLLILAKLNYDSYTFPNMDGLSPFECVLGHKAKTCPCLETTDTVITGTFKTYYHKLKKQLSLGIFAKV